MLQLGFTLPQIYTIQFKNYFLWVSIRDKYQDDEIYKSTLNF